MCYAEQLTRWKAESLRVDQRREVARLEQQLATLRATLATILALAERLKTGTIDTILAKSDMELGLDVLLGRIPRPEAGTGER